MSAGWKRFPYLRDESGTSWDERNGVEYRLPASVTFSDTFDAEALDPRLQRSPLKIYRDGNVLLLKARHANGYATMKWFARIRFVRVLPGGGTTEPSKRDFILGCWSRLSQAEARRKAVVLVAHLRNHSSVPGWLTPFQSFKAWFDDGGEADLGMAGAALKASPDNLLDDAEISSLHAYGMPGRTHRMVLRGNLGIQVDELRFGTVRRFFFSARDRITGRKIWEPMCDAATMSVSEAARWCAEISSCMAEGSDGTDLEAVRRAVQRLSAVRMFGNGAVLSAPGTYVSSVRIEITERAVEALYDRWGIAREKKNEKCDPGRVLEDLKRFAPFVQLDRITSSVPGRCALPSRGAVDWAGAVAFWAAHAAKSRNHRTRKKDLRLIERFTSQFDGMNLDRMLEERTLNRAVLAVASVSPRMGGELFRKLDSIISYLEALELCGENTLHRLGKVLSAPPHTPMRSLDPNSLGPQIRELFARYVSLFQPIHRLAFELLFYTLLRCGELFSLRKSQLVWENGVLLRIRCVNTKTLREFNVPVTAYASRLLSRLIEITKARGSDFLFPSARDPARPMCAGSASSQLRRHGCMMLVPHGIRSVGAAFFASREDIQYQVGMACLQHIYASAVHLRYDRTFLYSQRVGAMQKWSDFLELHIGACSYAPAR